MPNINDINGVTIANLSKLDGVTKANIAKVLGLDVTAAAAFLLDTYTGAAAGYSVRRIASSATNLMRIREDSGDTETDIGYDSNGDLDLAAIASHCGTANGFVVSWVDQSGNGNDADQSTTTAQPKIYDGTTQAVITENGKPALNIVGKYFDVSGFSIPSPWTLASVAQQGNNLNRYLFSFALLPAVRGAYGTFTIQPGTHAVGTMTSNQELYAAGYNSSSGVAYGRISGSETVASGTAASYTAQSSGDIFTHNNSTANGFNGSAQEFILWDSDQRAANNIADIETNINSEYLIYQPTDAPTSGLLATYTGAAAAYSVRQLADTAVIAITVRRDSDDEEKRFGFDSNGDLDTTGIADFCTTANGYVSQWWDQSTNGNHATQSTSGSQPQIYNGTAVLTEDGKPIITPTAAVQQLDFSVSSSASGVTGFMVIKESGVLGTPTSCLVADAQGNVFSNYILISSQNSTQTIVGNNLGNISYRLDGASFSPANRGAVYTAIASGNHMLNFYTDYTSAFLGRFGYPTTTIAMFALQEAIFYPSNEFTSGNLSGIETDISNYFSTP